MKKSVLQPTQKLVHLGFEVDSVKCAFSVPERKRLAFCWLRESILGDKKANLKTMQQFIGKCQSLKAVFPASSLFTRACAEFLANMEDEVFSVLPEQVLSEIAFWRFVDSMTRPIPWRKEQHVSIMFSADSSDFKWGATATVRGVVHEFGDYWNNSVLSADICTKEATALFCLLHSVFDDLWDKRVDVLMDNEGLVLAWNGLRAISPSLVGVLRQIFLLSLELNFLLRLTWVKSEENPSDAPSRMLDYTDSQLVPELRKAVNERFGPFSVDLMATPSNAMVGINGKKLRFFSRFPMPGTDGVNVFSQNKPEGVLYVFPPFNLITSLIRLFNEWGGVKVVIIAPVFREKRMWWTALRPHILDELVLFEPETMGGILFPSKKGFVRSRQPLGWGLKALKCFFPCSQMKKHLIEAGGPALVVLVGDSIMKALEKATWPKSMKVFVKPRGGERFMESLYRLEDIVGKCAPKMVVLHSGINDVSKFGDVAVGSILTSFKLHAKKIAGISKCVCAVSGLIQTKDPVMNALVAQINLGLEEAAKKSGWVFVSNDAIQQCDLRDEVHLNELGGIKFQRKLCYITRAGCDLPTGVFL